MQKCKNAKMQNAKMEKNHKVEGVHAGTPRWFNVNWLWQNVHQMRQLHFCNNFAFFLFQQINI